jgi:dolichol-phosphate mannosyltransferase
MKKIYAILPCYNEAENIGALITDWLSHQEEFLEKGYELTVIAIDDKSKDETKNIILDFAEKHENVSLIAHEINQNLGGVLKTGFEYFRENGNYGDVCVVMDGDNTHDPKFSLSMFEKIETTADCVIASRYCNESEVVGVPGVREFLSTGAKWYYKLILGVRNVQDYTCGYRMYTYEMIEKAINVYGESFVERKTFSCMMEVLYKLYKIGCRFEEVGFVLRYDKKEGQSKMRILKTVRDSLVTALKLKFSLR